MTALSRRDFSLALGAAATGVLAATAATAEAPALTAEALGISRDNAAIRQEMIFRASAADVFRALTEARRFDKVVALSKAMRSMKIEAAPCEISLEPGGGFSLFGGYITGRQVEVAPASRIIQTWRSEGWPPHIHSIVRFDLADHADGARVALHQIGFPNDDALSVATGWHDNYWTPLTAVLARG